MEKNKKIEINLVTAVLIIVMLIAIIMGYFIFKLYNENTSANNKNTELSRKVETLENKLNNMQTTVNTESNTINNANNNTETNTQDVDEKEENKTNTENTNKEKEILYEYTSADNNAANGNPETLKVYEFTNSQVKFKYHAAWNTNDISGIATKKENNIYTFKNNNTSINFTFNKNDNSVKVEEFEGTSLTGTVTLWK